MFEIEEIIKVKKYELVDVGKIVTGSYYKKLKYKMNEIGDLERIQNCALRDIWKQIEYCLNIIYFKNNTYYAHYVCCFLVGLEQIFLNTKDIEKKEQIRKLFWLLRSLDVNMIGMLSIYLIERNKMMGEQYADPKYDIDKIEIINTDGMQDLCNQKNLCQVYEILKGDDEVNEVIRLYEEHELLCENIPYLCGLSPDVCWAFPLHVLGKFVRMVMLSKYRSVSALIVFMELKKTLLEPIVMFADFILGKCYTDEIDFLQKDCVDKLAYSMFSRELL